MFRGLLRPGQGFKAFVVYRRTGKVAKSGRPQSGQLRRQGIIWGIISQATPKDIEQHKQLGHPITHTIVQRGTENQARATDVLELVREPGSKEPKRRFLVQTHPQNPGELDHFLIYHVEEREDL